MPSSKPVLNIVSAPKDAFLKSVEANPIFLNVTGAFDPGTQKQQFAEVLRTSFESYSQVNVGNILNAFDMTVMFMDDLTQHVVATGTNESLNTAWCEVNVTFNVGSNTETGLDSLTTEKGSMLVLKFFLASRKTQLIVDLNNTGIPVNDIEAFYALPDDIKAILDADLMKVQAGLAGATTAGNGDSSTGSQSNTVLIAAVASGGVIFVALGVVLLSHRHKNRVGMEAYGKESLTGDSSSYSDSSDAHAVKFVTGENGTEVKPAALHVRMQRERERQEKAVSANSTVSSYRTSETPTGNMTTGYANKGNGGTLSYSSGGEVHERALARLEDGPNLIASGALTCLDGEESVGALNEAYPEFDLYQMANSSPPPSPVWSVGNFSNTTPYSAEEDYIAARRRWHDEANDLELIALPDHGDSSDPESASHSHSDASSKIEKV